MASRISVSVASRTSVREEARRLPSLSIASADASTAITRLGYPVGHIPTIRHPAAMSAT